MFFAQLPLYFTSKMQEFLTDLLFGEKSNILIELMLERILHHAKCGYSNTSYLKLPHIFLAGMLSSHTIILKTMVVIFRKQIQDSYVTYFYLSNII